MDKVELNMLGSKITQLNEIAKLNYSIEINKDSIRPYVLYGTDKLGRILSTQTFETGRELFYYLKGILDCKEVLL